MLSYRSEIDGLRAIAVLPVIMFHAGLAYFGGGFVGVDVFFVISGFLITSIIITDIENNKFTIIGFYERRIRRIIPALFFVILCCIPVAVLVLLPPSLREFSASITSVILFISNIFFWMHSDYFAESSNLKPLLHTWSLAVEEQYYVVFPLILLVLWKHLRRRSIYIVAFMAIISLLMAEWGSRDHVTGTFFLAPSRAWELLAGAICAILCYQHKFDSNNILSFVGLTAIFLAVFSYDEHTRAPSIYILLPVIGACLVLLYAREQTLVARILSTRPLVGIGLISYSAYLWHQPLFAFARALSIEAPPWSVMAALSLLTFALAYLTWRFVERPFRQRKEPMLGRSSLFAAAAATAGGLGLLGLAGYFGDGFPTRLPSTALVALDATMDSGAYRNECIDGPSFDRMLKLGDKCRLGAPDARLEFVLWGDSIAGALADGIDLAARRADRAGMIFGLHACPPLLGAGGWGRGSAGRCPSFQAGMMDTIDKLGVRKVVLAASWQALGRDYYVNSMRQGDETGQEAFAAPLMKTIEELRKRNISVVIIGPYPEADVSIPEAIAKSVFLGKKFEPNIGKDEFLRKNSVALSLFNQKYVRENVQFIDLTDRFCDGEHCSFASGTRSFFFDSGHLTLTTSLSLSDVLGQALGGMKQEAAAARR
jgi:peptidoglycan/LPS O-acetylase OafA/YrhL